MKIDVLPNTLMFTGMLDEEVSLTELLDAFAEVRKLGAKPPVVLDLSKVIYANSAGVVVFVRFICEAKLEFKYVNAPIWLINQFNMIKDYFENGSYVESFQAPFFSSATKNSLALNLQIGKDVPVLKDYGTYRLPNRVVDGTEYEIDFSPDRYLSFISENYASFKEKIK